MAGNDQYSISLSVSLLSQAVRYLASLGIDTLEVFRSAGVDPLIMESPDARISLDSYLAVENAAIRVTNDPYFGLHVGEYSEVDNWSIVGFMMMNCQNLGEVFQKSARYSSIVGNLIQGRAQIGFRKIKMIFSTLQYAPELPRHCFDALFSGSVHMMRTLTGKPIDPLEVTFSHAPPESVDEYRRIFRSPVLFGQKNSSMTFDLSVVYIPVLMPNAKMLEHFENYAKEYLAELEGADRTTRRVTKQILLRMDQKKVNIKNIAADLSMSVRTLQNRLKREGTVFSELLEDTRRRLAEKYLRENESVEDITYLLGFTDASAFRRAFKKWSSMTPKEYRELSRAESRPA